MDQQVTSGLYLAFRANVLTKKDYFLSPIRWQSSLVTKLVAYNFKLRR